MPVAILAVRFASPFATVVERSTYLAYGLPGIVVGLALIVVCISFVPGVYGTTAVLLVAYAILALPLALVAVRGALAQAPPVHEEVARSLGLRPWAARLRVTLPAILPGLGAAAALVFLATVTELTATLLLAPIGTQHPGDRVLGERLYAFLRRRGPICGTYGLDLRRAHLSADPKGRGLWRPDARHERGSRHYNREPVEGLRRTRSPRPRPRGRGRHVHGRARPLGLRQDDAAAPDRRL